MRSFLSVVVIILVVGAVFTCVSWFWIGWLVDPDNARLIEVVSRAFTAGVTTVAFVIGGLWTYQRFISGQQHLPRGNLFIRVGSYKLQRSGTLLLRVALLVKNAGSKALKPQWGRIEVDRIDPPINGEPHQPGPGQAFLSTGGEDLAPWKTENEVRIRFCGTPSCNELDGRTFELAPGEHQRFSVDFTISSDVKLLRVYAWITDSTKKNDPPGWAQSVLYDVVKARMLTSFPEDVGEK